jgi:hypothetical protein
VELGGNCGSLAFIVEGGEFNFPTLPVQRVSEIFTVCRKGAHQTGHNPLLAFSMLATRVTQILKFWAAIIAGSFTKAKNELLL